MADRDLTDVSRSTVAMLEALLRRTHLSVPEQLAAIVAEEARAIGAERLVLHLVDFEQRHLVPIPAPDAEGREPLSIQGTVGGRAFTSSSILQVEGDEGRATRVWLPLLDGTERLGVMEVTFEGEPASVPDALIAVCERYAHLTAMLIVTKGAYSDVFERVRRRRPMSVAGELLWSLAPPLVTASDDFVLGGMLEPCYDMGGDAVDYALNGAVLHLAVFDAMGHGLAAAGASAFALSAYRSSRRQGDDLAETYAVIDAAVADQYPADRFVTAALAELDVRTGRLRWISAGHPPPLLLRAGRLVKTLDLPPRPPLGLRLAGGPGAVGDESLEPGDMVLLYTDGLTEARRPGGELFTVERLGEFIERQAAAGQAAPETLRRLREAIIERGEGALQDDASALLVEWRRGTHGAVVPETV
jgi:hypothetical protein